MNIVQAIAELELRLGTLERAYDYLLKNNFSLSKPSKDKISEFREEAFTELQNKYPSLGLIKK